MTENSYYIDLENEFLADTYQKIPVLASNARGTRLWDLDGKEYLDFMAGYGVAILGHSFPAIREALMEQLERVYITHGSVYSPSRADFLRELSSVLPSSLTKSILSNSGAEAVEAAVKVSLKSTGRSRILSMKNAYHGKTLAALSLTHSQKYRKTFKDVLMPSVDFVEFGNIEILEEFLRKEDVAAVFLEPVQGEGGINIPPEGYLKAARQLTEQYGTLLVFDEIQSGLGRTGRMWAHENWGVIPDIMTIGKGIGGGVPMGVTSGKPEFVGSLSRGEQSSTTGGNPLACAAGTAVIKALKSGYVETARQRGQYIMKRMNDEIGNHRLVSSTRGIGMMIAIELRIRFLPILMNMMENGLITLYSGINTIRLLPPYIASEEDIDEAVEIMKLSLDRQLESAKVK